MRLDKLAMEKIRYLEHKYGQLSNIPEDHPYIEKLSVYGKNTPPKKLDTSVHFYLTKDELEKANNLTIGKGKARTTELRKWLVGFLEQPFTLNLTQKVPMTERIQFNIYKEDHDKLMNYANKSHLTLSSLLSIIVKTKLNEL